MLWHPFPFLFSPLLLLYYSMSSFSWLLLSSSPSILFCVIHLLFFSPLMSPSLIPWKGIWLLVGNGYKGPNARRPVEVRTCVIPSAYFFDVHLYMHQFSDRTDYDLWNTNYFVGFCFYELGWREVVPSCHLEKYLMLILGSVLYPRSKRFNCLPICCTS